MRAGMVFLLLSAAAFCQAPDAAKPNPSLDIVVQDVTGDVTYQLGPKAEWKTAEKGAKLAVGTVVSTGESSAATISFGANSAALVKEISMFTIVSFGMQGDKLAAVVKVDPGVVSVSVTQLPQYQTDFQVSTPRLTASVRGTKTTVIANGDELYDTFTADEHTVYGLLPSGQRTTVAQGGKTDSKGTSPVDNSLLKAMSNVTNTGSTTQESGNATVLANTSQTLATTASDLTSLSTSSPTTSFAPPPPPNNVFANGTIELFWGPMPRDLDSHLYVPIPNQALPFEVAYFARNAPDGSATLLNDDTNGNGHEVTQIYRFNPGTYTFFVDNFSHEVPIGQSQGRVVFTAQPGPQATSFNVDPNATARFWTVFKATVDSTGHVNVSPVNTYSSSAPPR